MATEKAFFFAFGEPDTGKSTFIDAVMGTLGDYAASAAFTTWLVQTNTGGKKGRRRAPATRCSRPALVLASLAIHALGPSRPARTTPFVRRGVRPRTTRMYRV